MVFNISAIAPEAGNGLYPFHSYTARKGCYASIDNAVRTFPGLGKCGRLFLSDLSFRRCRILFIQRFHPPLEKVFGWDRATIALAMSIYMISGGLVSPITGKLVEKFGSKRIMVMSGVLAGACYMLVSLTRSIGYYYVIYGLLAVCTSGIGIIPATHLIACWFKYNRGLATGIVMMGFSAGGMMMAPLINFTTSQWGWESAYLLIGGMVWGWPYRRSLFLSERPPVHMEGRCRTTMHNGPGRIRESTTAETLRTH